MAVGFSSLLRFWASSKPAGPPPAPTVGFGSLLAFWAPGGAGTGAAEALAGRLVRSRRRRRIYDEDSELGRLATLLGQHPPERDAKSLTAAVKRGLAGLFESGAPPAVSYAADGALILTLIDQQIRLSGALKRHVEILQDDQEILDLLDMIT